MKRGKVHSILIKAPAFEPFFRLSAESISEEAMTDALARDCAISDSKRI